MPEEAWAVSVAARAACLALTIGFLEQLTVFRRAYGPDGPFSAAVAGVFARPGHRVLARDGVARGVLVVGAVTGAVGLVVGPLSVVGWAAGLLCVLAALAIKARRVTAGDGAEQISVLVLLAVSLALAPVAGDPALDVVALFIGAVSVLSYVTAGLAKAVSRTWRSGAAIAIIMGSTAYGRPGVAALLDRRPALGVLLARATVAFECAFPLVLLAPLPVTLAFLAAGLGFHLGTAATMGLNTFVWAFVGTYPAVLVLARATSPFW
ncbi:hypothetical protein [Georgenia muralis]|uniref:HTTM-like domain-containing protein n=1 Tax=Georgenia muralis TaxID=154117 RepID=A0A3N4Z117_9MICO|nr:hypothetical protein [Georgenia muralis]RPF26233.1 hypothetical protein EDD32_0665 [Georgenia muralis]